MTDSAWLETAKDDIAQWAMVMTKDADDNPIDWRWVRSLDLFGGLGHTAGDNPTPQAIHDALKADYAVRDRLEPIIAQCSTAFMTDFDRIIASYRLPRALAYVNRRLNDTINTLLDAGERRHLWKVSRERLGRGMAAVLKPYSSATADPNQGTLDAELKVRTVLPALWISPSTIFKTAPRRFLTPEPNGAGPSVSKATRVGWIWLVPTSPVQRHRVGASPCLAMTRQVLVPPRISPNRIGVMPTCRDVTWTW